MNNKLLNIFKDQPDIINSIYEMDEANSSIIIYKGPFIIKLEDKEIIIKGAIQFEWFPNSGVTFSGIQESSIFDINEIFNKNSYFDLVLDGTFFGKGLLTNISFGSNAHVKGILSQQAIKGDKTIAVSKIKFLIPNLREFYGLSVKKVTDKGISCYKNRIILENDNYNIIIDKCHNYKELQDSLNSKGGYIFQYVGELVNKKGSILLDDIKDTMHCLGMYLSFLNGRRTSALFIQGIYEEEIIWCDYTNYVVDSYKYVFSWTQEHSTIGLNELWQEFSNLWQDKDDRNFLISAIHWYNEANCNSGYVEGSIIMAQTALELIYNWLLIENKKILIGRDAENISATNKIRLLLSHLNISYDVPSAFGNLKLFINEDQNVIDAPDAVVQIRNAIVHSQEEKRKKLSSIHYKAKYETLKLCIWYVEMALLSILNFDNIYLNRCSGETNISDTKQLVPWTKKKIKT